MRNDNESSAHELHQENKSQSSQASIDLAEQNKKNTLAKYAEKFAQSGIR